VGDTAEVVVERGIVSVSRTEQTSVTAGQLLVAPARLSVNVRTYGIEPRAAEDPDRSRPRLLPVPSTKASQSTLVPKIEQQPDLAQRPSPAEVERIWDVAAQAIAECFASQAGTDPNVRVSFATQVEIRLDADGAVVLADFNPPVPQPVLGCAEQRIARLRTPPTQLGATISRAKMLTR
jgi:hypothetical protein